MPWIAPVIMLAAAAANQYNTNQVAKKQDSQAAIGIMEQGRRQKQADAKVNDEVQKLKTSDASDERATRLQDYMTTLARGKQSAQAGLTPDIGGAAFKADSAQAATAVQDKAASTAGLMARIDAPGMQRQGEGFDYGNLATDLDLIKRQAAGEDFLNQLRIRAIRRNPYIDLAAATASGYAGALAGGGGGSKQSAGYVPVSQGGTAVYGNQGIGAGAYRNT